MRKKNKVTAEMLLNAATDGLLYNCYQIVPYGSRYEDNIIYDEENGIPYVVFNNIAAASEGEIRKFFNERPWLKDMVDIEYKKFHPLLICKVYLKAKKKDYNFWYGYLLMKQNG